MLSAALEQLPTEAAFEPAHQRARRALRRFLGDHAFVEPLDAGIEVGAGRRSVSGPLPAAWRRRQDRCPGRGQAAARAGGRRVAAISPLSTARWVSSQATMCMMRVVTFSDSQAKPTRAIGSSVSRSSRPGIVEIGARLVGEQHRLGIEGVDQPRRDPRLPGRDEGELSIADRFCHQIMSGGNVRSRLRPLLAPARPAAGQCGERSGDDVRNVAGRRSSGSGP